MALQLSYTANTGTVSPTAYAKITSFTGTKTSITCQVAIYMDKAARDSKAVVTPNSRGAPTIDSSMVRAPLTNKTFVLALVDGATYTQMYEALQLQAPFIGAMYV